MVLATRSTDLYSETWSKLTPFDGLEVTSCFAGFAEAPI